MRVLAIITYYYALGFSNLNCHGYSYARQFSTRNGGQSYKTEMESFSDGRGIGIPQLLPFLKTILPENTVLLH
jgi:hypothetical protein